jgi:hypothetical protein
MALLDMNMNMNMNMALAMSASGGRALRPRFNSDLESRLVDVTQPDNLVPATPPKYPRFHTFWDADLHACVYLDEFLRAVNDASSTNDWRNDYKNAALASGANVPPIDMGQHDLGGQVLRILELALEREDRFAEIIDQDDADGAINYWLGMLKIDPARHPYTFLMVHVARRIGEQVSMCLKGAFACPRPSQLCPAITPMIDPPVTPSFPAGHALQSYLISYMLAYSLTKLPGHNTPQTNYAAATGPLFDLAARVSENRVVAGIHYPVDIDAGRAVAIRAFTDLQTVDSIWKLGSLVSGSDPDKSLHQGVQDEFPQYK